MRYIVKIVRFFTFRTFGVFVAGCDSEECGWDGGDCIEPEEERRLAAGTLIIIVALPPAQFEEVAQDFLRNLSILLHSVVSVKQDDDGRDMIFAWPRDSQARRKRDVTSFVVTSHVRRRRDESNDVQG